MAETRYICKHSDGMGHCKISDDWCCSGPCTLEEDIEYAPVRHGRWLCVDTDEEQFFLCNRCKKKEYWESNYCPNCGAKMDGE